MRTITKIRRSTRGLSPIFATLILIAIAVIAGIIVYMFTSGTLASMMGGGTAGQEKITIQSASGVATGATVTVIYQSTGGPLPAVNALLLKDAAGNTVGQASVSSSPTATGVLTTISNQAITMNTGATMVKGNIYTVTLVTAAGGSFVSPSFAAS